MEYVNEIRSSTPRYFDSTDETKLKGYLKVQNTDSTLKAVHRRYFRIFRQKKKIFVDRGTSNENHKNSVTPEG